VLSLLFVLLQVYFWPYFSLDVDSSWYAQLVYQYLGHDPHTAHVLAEQLWCVGQPPDCMAVNAAHFAPTGDPRYAAIFDTRPGYPLMVAGLFSVIGHMRFSMWIIPVVCTLLAGLGIYWLLRLLGLIPGLAAAGQALFYLLPTGVWGVHALTEGPITAGAVAAILAGVLLARGRFALGTGLLVIGLGSMAAVKYSTALPVAGFLLVAAILCWWRHDADRRGLAILGGVSLLTLATVLYISDKLSLPGFNDTAQDLFTNHWATPLVPNPIRMMISANHYYWVNWLTIDSNNALLLAGVIVGLVALFRFNRMAALLVLASVLVGFAQAAVHPLPTQGNRLYLLAWLAVIVGLPVAAHLLMTRRQPEEDKPVLPEDESPEEETRELSRVGTVED
jgi:hypothetical protein